MANSTLPALLGGKPLFDPPIPITRPTLPPPEELLDSLQEILSTGMLTTGKYVRELEARVAEYLGVPYAVAVSSCTSGLMLVLRAYGLVGEVLLPSFTFPVTGHVALWNQLEPHFVDIDPQTFNMDPHLVEQALGPKTAAILGVHIYGNPSYPTELEEIARRHGVKLVFDAAHGLGATYRGRKVGSFGDAEVFSLSPTKLVVAGEGGIVATRDEELARLIRIGRDYANPGNYDTEYAGMNARMPEMNAALGLKTLEMLDENVKRRNRLVGLYRDGLGQLPGLRFQVIDEEADTTYKDFGMLTDSGAFGLSRDELAVALEAEGVITRKYYSPPLHRQRAYAAYKERYDGRLPVTEEVAGQVLCLPLFSHMEMGSVEAICEAVTRVHHHQERVREYLAQNK